MQSKANARSEAVKRIQEQEAFSRLDEGSDLEFYSRDRFVSHLDAVALETVEKLIGELVSEENPVILDLMAGWDSHLPRSLQPQRVIGLGLNHNELSANRALNEIVIHDLNSDPTLPFPEAAFDVVLNTVSVDYLTHPKEIFREVGRILKPGGLFLVLFSNRMFPQKAVKAWRDASEEGRVALVEDFFAAAGMYENPSVFVSRGKARPKDDKYSHLLEQSDPIYAVYSEKEGGDPDRRARPVPAAGGKPSAEEVERRKSTIKDTLCCPYCEEKLNKWEVPDNPFGQTWDNDFMYICFNDECSYYVRGWDCMERQGNRGVSYRLMYNPEKDRCLPIPVRTPYALREGIMEE